MESNKKPPKKKIIINDLSKEVIDNCVRLLLNFMRESTKATHVTAFCIIQGYDQKNDFMTIDWETMKEYEERLEETMKCKSI